MRRKITDKLQSWCQRSEKKPLVLTGARQTGKTTSVLTLGHEAFDRVIHIDFYRQPHLKAAFEGSLEPRSVISALEALLQTDIEPGKALLFLDEIQDCDGAITALKFFCSDAPEYDVIAAGSLLGVHIARSGSVPVGYVDMLSMYPMDFEEFCWAMGERRAFDLVRESYAACAPCPLHDHMLELYRSYLMVGGMPEAVSNYANGARLYEVRVTQNNIRTAYVADMAKYATAADTAKIVACWESVPAQLAKENGSTKFQWKLVGSGAKAERYGAAIDWLAASGIVNKCTQVTDGVSPLKSFENPSSFKIYLGDTGLLSSAYDAAPADLDGKDHRSARFRGGIAENYVMQQLVASGSQPYYWGAQSTYEVEFVLKLGEGVVPVEVKSADNVRLTSAKRFAEKYESPYIIRVTGKNFGKTELIRNVPLYAAGLIAE